MFSLLNKATLNAQLGPFETFEELQAAASREMPGVPGTILVKADLKSKTPHAGAVTDSQGNVTGEWKEASEGFFHRA